MLPVKREWEEANDDGDVAMASTSEITPTIELTQENEMRLLDLNDDCLLLIFSQKSLNMVDLCSVAECCTRLKRIAESVFLKLYKICIFRNSQLKTVDETRKVLHNFGYLIKEIEIGPLLEPTLELMMEYCSETLESLKLFHCRIRQKIAMKLGPMFNRLETIHIRGGFIEVADKTIFSNCASLVELKVIDHRFNYENNRMIFENQFPKLERFHYLGAYDENYNLESFISNHKKLKELFVENISPVVTPLIPLIANNCHALEKVATIVRPSKISTEFVRNLKTLLTLRSLKELRISCNDSNIIDFIIELPKLTSLEVLELRLAKGDSAFILALSQLKNIKTLHLLCCEELGDLNPLANMEQLNELWIICRCWNANFKLVEVIKRLRNLKELVLVSDTVKIDINSYLNIADVVRKSAPYFLKLGVSDDNFDQLKHEVRNIQNVKLYHFYDVEIRRYIERFQIFAYLSSDDSDYDDYYEEVHSSD